MKKWMVVGMVAALSLVIWVWACGAQDDQPKDAKGADQKATPAEKAEGPLKTQKDKVSYIFGLDLGTKMKQSSVKVDTDVFLKGLKDGLAGAKPLLTEEEIREVMAAFQQEMMAKAQEKMKTLGDANKKAGDAYLAENKKKEGVVTIASGLQYRILKAGDGPKPKATDTVTVHYAGRLVDGTEFDSSYKRNEPATFPLENIIRGWGEALQLMPVGSKWEVVIPAELAYGERGRPPVIGPNATLIFEIELLSVKAAEAPKTEGEAPKKEGDAPKKEEAAPKADAEKKQ
jgi:FKBP-type peptidyl-prolyl cis-trans isomerase